MIMKANFWLACFLSLLLFIIWVNFDKNLVREIIDTREVRALKTRISTESDIKFISFDHSTKRLEIKIGDLIGNGSDGACEYFAEFVWALFEINPEMTVFVHGSFVPSRENPITRTWASHLVGYSG